MFKLPNPPSPQAGVHELADFVEILSWLHRSASEREIVAYLGRIDDNDSNEGCNDDEDQITDFLEEVMNEIERRATACESGYPFVLEGKGTVLKFAVLESEAIRSSVYLYLLLSTRLNMQCNRTHANIDGADLLENLSAHVLRTYLGSSKAQSLVVGTSNPGTFQDRVNNLCQSLGEGSRFRSLDNASIRAKDDKVDTVTWIPFVDRLPGQLIVFGQCKTGTNWRDQISQSRPEDFIKKWMHEPFLVNPLRVFCVSEAVDRSRWKGTSVAAGILFDRCRLVEYCVGLDAHILTSIQKWTAEAKKTINFNG